MLLLLFLALTGAPPPPADPPDDCGEEDPTLPSFALEDRNPSSGSQGQSLGLDDFPDHVRVLYFASATCGVCKSHVQALDGIAAEQQWPDVQILVVNLPPYVGYVSDLTDLTDLPVLQDTDEQDVAEQYGAAKWYVYLVDKQGHLRALYYDLDLPDDDRQRFIDEVEALR